MRPDLMPRHVRKRGGQMLRPGPNGMCDMSIVHSMCGGRGQTSDVTSETVDIMLKPMPKRVNVVNLQLDQYEAL